MKSLFESHKSSISNSSNSKSKTTSSITLSSSSSIDSSITSKNSTLHQDFTSFSENKVDILSSEMIENLLIKKVKIGKGATSTVYKVINIITKKGFSAIRILDDAPYKLTDDTKSKSAQVWSFEDEELEEENIEIGLKKVKNLNHQNIIKIYGFFFGDHKNPPAILLEYCKFNLEKAIQHLDDIDLIGVIYEICSAMMYN